MGTLCFGVERKILDSRILWTAWAAVFIAVRYSNISRFLLLSLRDLDFVGIHKEIQEVETRQPLHVELGKFDPPLWHAPYSHIV